MVLQRLEWHLEEHYVFHHSMTGFRRHVSTQDTMLRIQHDVLIQSSTAQTRVVAAVDIHKAFDNVMHHADEPSKTRTVFRNGFYYAGDKAYKDNDGYLWFYARADDVIISAGYRIGPFEVESVLAKHPAVAECAVVGSPDLNRGEDPLGGSTVDVAKNGGPTVVSMVGEDVDPDFCAGWMRARARGGTQVEKEPRPSSYVARKVIEKVERIGRMPRVGLEGENKVVVRPRCGLDLRKTSIVVVADAIRAAAGISEEEASLDTQCPNVQQNVVVISTGSDARAVKYAAVTCICVAGRSYEVRAYVTAPFDTVKGVIRGVPVHHTTEEIERLLIVPRNPTVRAAERIGSSATVVVIFGGDVVPHQVFYGGSVLRCSLYRKHYEVCKTCGRVGHRTDVFPTPGVRRCLGCGGTPDPGHACSPRCGLFGGPHVTGDKVRKNRFRTPYIVRRRLWERAERGLSGDRPSPPPRGSAEEYPRLGRSRSRSRESERPAARSRSRSTSGQVTWAQAVQSDRGRLLSCVRRIVGKLLRSWS
ncbi:uncharacterized protein ISCGN_021840 [Ixodes scapularis]